MKIELKISPPKMPNFFSYDVAPGRREDGVNLGNSIPIESLSEDEAIEFGEMMKQEFIKHWKDRKLQQSSQF
jgi:hypothetical protein